VFFFSSRRRHTRSKRDWSSDVCSSDLAQADAPRVFAVCANHHPVGPTLLHPFVQGRKRTVRMGFSCRYFVFSPAVQAAQRAFFSLPLPPYLSLHSFSLF